MKIKNVRAREILSTGAVPTVETVVGLENGVVAVASVPFGTSAGKHEALTLADGDKDRYMGKGMLKAVGNVNDVIAPSVVGMEVEDQQALDEKLVSLDPSDRRERLGGNSILSVSLAAARAAAGAAGAALYEHIRSTYGITEDITALPMPMMVMIEGGCHAHDSTDMQEYMVGVLGDVGSREAVRAGIEVYHALGAVLKAADHGVNVGLEGAYAPPGIRTNKEPLGYIAKAIENAGYSPGEDVGIALDPASSEFYSEGLYDLAKEDRKLTAEQLIAQYEEFAGEFPIFSIEDGLAEDDWEAWPVLNQRLGGRMMIVGDDLTTTNVARLQKAIDLKAINTILIKPNQVGTLSETMAAIELAKANGLRAVVSHRGGGETTDTFIIDLAVATNAAFVKVGPSRGERVVKYNRLMEIGESLGL